MERLMRLAQLQMGVREVVVWALYGSLAYCFFFSGACYIFSRPRLAELGWRRERCDAVGCAFHIGCVDPPTPTGGLTAILKTRRTTKPPTIPHNGNSTRRLLVVVYVLYASRRFRFLRPV